MSKCISSHGEYSEHDLNQDHVCRLCHVLDEDAMVAEIDRLRAELAASKEEREREDRRTIETLREGLRYRRELQERLAAVEPVVEAAKAWRADFPDQKPYGFADQGDGVLITAVDALAAAEQSTPDPAATTEDPWATNDVYTVACPTCGRMASAYCVNFQGREVYPAHAARYQRLTEPMDVPIHDTPEAGKGETDDATAKLAVTSRGLAMHAVLSDVIDERYRQDAKWGQSNHADGTGPDWRLFGSSGVDWQRAVDAALDQATRSGFAWHAGDEIREIPAPGVTWMLIALKQIFGVFVETDPATIRSKLIRVAAVGIAWAEAIDRRADSRAGQAGQEVGT